MMILCPDCRQPLDLSADPEIGQHLTCEHCHAVLEVTWLFPLSLDFLEIKEPPPLQKDESDG